MQQKQQMRQKHWPNTCARTLNPNNFQVTQNSRLINALLRIPVLRYNRAHDEEAAAGVVVNSEFCKGQEFLSFPSCCAENSRVSKFRSFRTFCTSEFRNVFGVSANQTFKVSKFSRLFADRSSQVLQIFANQSSWVFANRVFILLFFPVWAICPRAGRGGVWASSIGVHKRTFQTRILSLAVHFNILAFSLDKLCRISSKLWILVLFKWIFKSQNIWC